MPTTPFAFLNDLIDKLSTTLQPPDWVIGEVQQRAVLFLNHVLMQEPEAQKRLAGQQGRVVRVQWRSYLIELVITPAGLLDRAMAGATADLTLTVTQESPLELAQAAMRGDKPPVRIEGDVQFAAEINWIVENVRWDVEEDLSRVIGDGPAHTVSQGARRAAEALRKFAGSVPPGQGGPTA